jgi:hypothetical protein
MEWRAYLDESYNEHVFCVGGFLAPEPLWKSLEDQWVARLQYENEKSAVGGYPRITRYHATDCANLKGEFQETRGWDINRQVKLTKRLCEIIGDEAPAGLVVGGRTEDMKAFLNGAPDCPKQSLYDLCFRMTMLLIVSVMRERFPGTRVGIVIDRGKNFESVARHGFEFMSEDDTVPYLRECFTGLDVEDSVTCTRLQAADFMAYEAMRQLEFLRRGRHDMRKSLRALIGTEIPLHISQFTEQNFSDMRKMIDNGNAGRRTDDGVDSGIEMAVTSGHALSLLP